MEKIVLLNPPSNSKIQRDYYCSHTVKGNYLWQPTDFIVISQRIKTPVIFLDCIKDDINETKALSVLNDISPDKLFFLISEANFRKDFEFLLKIKKMLENTSIVLTGDSVLSKSDFIRKKININYFIKNFVKDNYEFLENILSNEKNEFFIPLNENKISYFIDDKYFLPHLPPGKLFTTLSTFGCPFSCKYCHFEKINFILRNPSNFYEELKILDKLGVKTLHFRDQTFGFNKEHLKEITRILKKFDFKFLIYTRSDTLNFSELKELKKAGLYSVEIGVESYDEKIRAYYGKNIKNKTYEEFFKNLKKLNIKSLAIFIIGLSPNEEKLKFLKFIKKLSPDFLSLNALVRKSTTSLNENANLFDQADPSGKSNEKNEKIRKYLTKKYYFSPYFLTKVLKEIKDLKTFKIYLKNGISLLKK
jgi:radical SAM superfamily enzyme YgiQ (UPF0313 family)